ncbi:uncharacterized protein WM277_011726 [Molossus nigricans]
MLWSLYSRLPQHNFARLPACAPRSPPERSRSGAGRRPRSELFTGATSLPTGPARHSPPLPSPKRWDLPPSSSRRLQERRPVVPAGCEAAAAAAGAAALAPHPRERPDQGPSLESAGGRPREGRTAANPLGGCGARGSAGGAFLGEVSPPGRRPAPPHAPDPAPGRLLGKRPERTFRWGASGGRGGRSGWPGMRTRPAWVQLGKRRRQWQAAGGPKAAAGEAEKTHDLFLQAGAPGELLV